MLLIHAGAIASVGQGLVRKGIPADLPGLALRGAILLASAVFFALKLADVAWLRLAPGWRSSVASLVIVGLLHVGVFQRATDHAPWMTPVKVGVALSLASAVGLARASRRWSLHTRAHGYHGASSSAQSVTVLWSRLWWSRFWRDQIKPVLSLVLVLSVPPRAPPISTSV